jgi:hypothetical protein
MGGPDPPIQRVPHTRLLFQPRYIEGRPVHACRYLSMRRATGLKSHLLKPCKLDRYTKFGFPLYDLAFMRRSVISVDSWSATISMPVTAPACPILTISRQAYSLTVLFRKIDIPLLCMVTTVRRRNGWERAFAILKANQICKALRAKIGSVIKSGRPCQANQPKTDPITAINIPTIIIIARGNGRSSKTIGKSSGLASFICYLQLKPRSSKEGVI